MTDHCPTCGAAVRVETSGRTSYMVPTDAERVRELENRIRELESINEGLLVAFDQFLRDEGYSDEEVGEFLCPLVIRLKEPPR